MPKISVAIPGELLGEIDARHDRLETGEIVTDGEAQNVESAQ